VSILPGRSQLLGPTGMPCQWFFLAIFLTAEPGRIAAPNRLGPMAVARVMSNAQRPSRPRATLASRGFLFCVARPQLNMQTDFRISIKFL